MIRRKAPRFAVLGTLSLAVLGPTSSHGATPGASATASTSVVSTAKMGHVGPPSGSAALPSGHPSLDAPPMQAGPLPSGPSTLPKGHPALSAPDESPPPGADLPEIPQDLAQDDTRIAPGTISVRIVDDTGQPVPAVPVTLGILRTSVAQGELRTHRTAATNQDGDALFDGLQKGSGWAYRVSVENASPDGTATAKYAAAPFSFHPMGNICWRSRTSTGGPSARQMGRRQI